MQPHWGYKRIRDYAEYLGYEVSFMTVKRILNKHGIKLNRGNHSGPIKKKNEEDTSKDVNKS